MLVQFTPFQATRLPMEPLPNNRALQNRHLPAFSLIELLAVMAIISILLVAAVPIFSNSSNNARETSREIIKAHLRQARAHAIASGTSTAVTIPVLGTGKDLGARSVSLFEVELENGSYIPIKDGDGNDILLQRAEILPGNFHFIPGSMISSDKITVVDLPETMATSYKGRIHDSHFIVFAANGQIVRPASGTPVNIAITQAARSGNSLTPTQKNGGQPVVEMFQVNRLTGRTRPLQP